MRIVLLALCVALASAAPASAYKFHENFESGTDGWTNWSGALQLNLSTDHNHTPGYTTSPGVPPATPAGHSFKADPAFGSGTYGSYAQWADGTGKLRLDAYLWSDNANGPPDPNDNAIGMLQLSQNASTSTDYIQFGWFGGYLGGPNEFSVRTRYRDTVSLQGVLDTNVQRPQINGWVKLSIEADAGVGGDLRFYVNNDLIYTGVGQRLGANLNTLRVGMNFGNSLQATWYDDITVSVPEPASAALVGFGSVAMFGLARRRRV